ncbi:ABC transporter ATP-binding protein [soil metagenome]
MSGLVLHSLAKSFGPLRAVEDVSLDIPDGSFACLLGPSGCGKTTLLRMIAGLEAPSAGRVVLGGADITSVPTHRRDLGMVFQSLALLQHLTAGENIAYPLRIRGIARAARAARVAELLDLVRLPGLEGRPVAKLSGGQRQRVAIARALALQPKLFLLDEPLSALDAKLREAMQVELRQLQARLAITTIVVTHDQREAMSMADIVVVMGEGRIRQAAPPLEVYREPADAFVAGFIGAANLLAICDGAVLGKKLPGIEGTGTLSIRPEDIELAPAGQAGGGLAGRVSFLRDLGSSVEALIEVEGQVLTAVLPPRERGRIAVGDRVGLSVPPEAARVLT